MIAQVTGNVVATNLDSLVVSVGGVGLAIMCSPHTISTAAIGEPIALHTSLIVREDSLTLFGFADAESKDLFELIQSVSGFGPRLAFTILSSMSANDLRSAIASEDIVRLTKTPGVGTKGASRLVLELKDRIGFANTGQTPQANQDWQVQVQQALVGLGWSVKDAAQAVAEVSRNSKDGLSVPELLKLALQELGR